MCGLERFSHRGGGSFPRNPMPKISCLVQKARIMRQPLRDIMDKNGPRFLRDPHHLRNPAFAPVEIFLQFKPISGAVIFLLQIKGRVGKSHINTVVGQTAKQFEAITSQNLIGERGHYL